MMSRSSILLPAILTALFALSQPAAAESAHINVRATVLPWLRSQIMQQVAQYRVSDTDLRRGFVDLPDALLIRYQSNAVNMIDLEIQGLGREEVRFLEEGTPAAMLQLPACGGVAQREQAIGLRVILPPDSTPGVYPLQVVATTHLSS